MATATKEKASKAKKAPAKTVAKKNPEKKTTTKKVASNKGEFSVIQTGGKQYIVSVGDVLEVERLGDFNEGNTIEFDKVLMNSKEVGTPHVKGAKVKAEFVAEKKGQKLSIIRFKAKSNRSRKIGHRQTYSRVEIISI